MKNPTFSNSIARVAGKLPLRNVLIFPFVLQIAATVGLVGYLSYRNGKAAVNNVASQLQTEISDRVNYYLKSYLATPHLINRINVDAVRLGHLDIENLPELERYLVSQMKQFDSITSIIFGSNRGNFIVSSRITGKDWILVSEPLDTSKIDVYLAGPLGKRGKLLTTFRQPDARKRPWYKAAVSAGKPTWTQIFQLGDNTGITINATQPIYAPANNKLLGVFSVSFNLAAINKLLGSLRVGKSGKIFIMERNGLLVANSTPENPYTITPKQEFKRLKATDSGNSAIAATSRYLTAQFGSEFRRIENKSEQLHFKIDRQRQFVQVMPFRDEFGLDWLIVVVVPESDFMEQINVNTRTTFLLSVAALMASVGMGILTARWIVGPILSLNAAAKDIAKGQWDKTVAINRADEVGELAKSFNKMAAQLQQSFSELQSLNAALVQSESKLNQILAAIPVGVAVHDITGQVIYINQTSRQFLEIETLPQAQAEDLAAICHVYLAETDLLYPTENLPTSRSLKGEQVRVDDMEIRLPDRTVPIEVYSTPLFDEQGEIVGAIATITDITERKQAEKLLADYNRTLEAEVRERTAELASANAQLEQQICDRKQAEIALASAKEAAEAASLAKSTFLANMSHELRTPLNGIMGYAQILQRDKNCNSQQRKDVDIIYQCSEHLLTLIDDILGLAKIEANQVELYPEMFNLSAFLSGLSAIFTLKSQHKSINFIYPNLEPLPKIVYADQKRLRQILINLLSNAVKFTQVGSVNFKVEVIANPETDTETEISQNTISEDILSLSSNLPTSQLPIAKIRFAIEDTGYGIAAEQLERIFLPFEQVGDIARRIEGTGLGLAIAQKLLSLMGSEICVESNPGVGSKFWFDLNLRLDSDLTELNPVKSMEMAIGYEGKKQKILVVDDNRENRSVIVNLLEPLGFEVAEAADGEAGLEKAAELGPDLILCDLVMPGMDGFWLLRELRQLPEFQTTITIAVSASVFEVDRQNCLRSGYNDFIAKPIKAEHLLAKIQNHLNLSWIYEQKDSGENFTAAFPLAASPQEITVPPREELVVLYKAAQGGYVEDVELEVMRLKQLNPEYTAFVVKVLEMSEDFEYQAIVRFLDRYL